MYQNCVKAVIRYILFSESFIGKWHSSAPFSIPGKQHLNSTILSWLLTQIILREVTQQWKKLFVIMTWNILTQTPNATRNGAKLDGSLFCRKTWMIYFRQLPSTKLLGTLIPFFRLRFTELCSDWLKTLFSWFSCSFKKVKRFVLPFYNVGQFR